MEKIYAVIDTNIVVSALLKMDSYPGSVIVEIFNNRVIPLVNKEIRDEYKEVLNRPKFRFDKNKIKDFLDVFNEYLIDVEVEKSSNNMKDISDIPFYEVYRESSKRFETYLITGNIKHFPKENNIMTPKDFIENVVKIR